ncbi:DUF1254 domain-containing protein [Vibrio kyushuensis]|uniref:DUF1254 domain-containing protein n=1 Tax=Vibrio kyushuensis TaxID=2910249 RepID=UPI003D14C00F
MKKQIIAATLALCSLSINAQDTFTNEDFTGLRVYHHAENMIAHIEEFGINQWDHPPISDHTYFVITPALDHLYSKAMVDVSRGPAILTTPIRDDRYASLQIVDSEHFTVYAETTPREGGQFLITRAGADYDIPDGEFTDIIEVHEDLTFLFVRTQTFEYRDDGYANENRHQLKLDISEKSKEFDLPDRKDTKAVIQLAIDNHDGWAETADELQGAVNNFDYDRYVQTAEYVTEKLLTGVITNNSSGFETPDHPDADHDSINLIRAAVTHLGHLGFPAAHAYYENIPVTPQGLPLNGSEAFVFTMPHEQAVGEFWSITRYKSATRLPLDPDTIGGSNRQVFAGGNTTPDADGNVTITFSTDDPKDGTYWMPVVDGEQYYFIVRYYDPQSGLKGNTAQTLLYGGTPLENVFVPKQSF